MWCMDYKVLLCTFQHGFVICKIKTFVKNGQAVWFVQHVFPLISLINFCLFWAICNYK